MQQVPLIRVGLAYKFLVGGKPTGWYILQDIRQNKSQIELICKGKEAHSRIFNRDQIVDSEIPKQVICEDLVKVDRLFGLDLYFATVVYWPYSERRGRKPKQVAA